jgi:hypothetical protein
MDAATKKAAPDPKSGSDLKITHRMDGDQVMYTVTQTFDRELLVGLAGGKRVFISVPHRQE